MIRVVLFPTEENGFVRIYEAVETLTEDFVKSVLIIRCDNGTFEVPGTESSGRDVLMTDDEWQANIDAQGPLKEDEIIVNPHNVVPFKVVN